jgi:hypothetical protein
MGIGAKAVSGRLSKKQAEFGRLWASTSPPEASRICSVLRFELAPGTR